MWSIVPWLWLLGFLNVFLEDRALRRDVFTRAKSKIRNGYKSLVRLIITKDRYHMYRIKWLTVRVDSHVWIRHVALHLRVLLGTHWVQKVGVLAVAVSCLLDLTQRFALVLELMLPCVVAVSRFCPLKATENVFVIVSHSCDLLNPDCPVERCIRVESIRVWLWLFIEHASVKADVFWLFEVDLKHFSEQDSILILDLTHTF